MDYKGSFFNPYLFARNISVSSHRHGKTCSDVLVINFLYCGTLEIKLINQMKNSCFHCKCIRRMWVERYPFNFFQTVFFCALLPFACMNTHISLTLEFLDHGLIYIFFLICSIVSDRFNLYNASSTVGRNLLINMLLSHKHMCFCYSFIKNIMFSERLCILKLFCISQSCWCITMCAHAQLTL